MDIEKNIMSKKFYFSFKDIKWIIITIITVIGWLFTGYLWVNDKSEMKKEVVNLKSQNKNLTEKVLRLEGQIEGVNNASEIFMKNSPSENRYRIEKLEGRVKILEVPGSNPKPIMNINMDTNIVRREHN